MRHRPIQQTTGPNWRRIDLEMSIKPFGLFGRAEYERTARRILKTWEKLIDRADELAALLWVGDSTELMIWNGDLDQPLEWGRYEGFCNLRRNAEPYFPEWFDNRPPIVYAPNLESLTYRDLRDIIAALKGAARDLYGLSFKAGMTFDPTPEFAESPFKYDEHMEILSDHPEGRKRYAQRFVSHQTALHADPRSFSGFPDGIAEGTTIGTFLGRQVNRFAEAFGYDYLWFSNGFGFSHYAWCANGELLETDGSWRTERSASQLALLERFWCDFRRECPELLLEFRGTNWPVGHDLSTDAASHKLIQQITRSDVGPPNIPVLHAELLAMDVTTYLTRMAAAPTGRLIYRAYLNDPWHDHNPWYDIYDREPFETYCCMSCARLRGDGSLNVPTDLHILTIDTERGEIPQDEVNEVVPHYLRALSERADAPGPLVWVYPFDDFEDVLRRHPDRLPLVYNCDHYIWRSIEAGVPLNTVCTASDFMELVDAGRAPRCIYIAPAPVVDGDYADVLLKLVADGGQMVVHGALDHAPTRLLDALGITLADTALDGDFQVDCNLSGDTFDVSSDPSRLPLRHYSRTGGGGIREMCGDGSRVRVGLRQSDHCRAWCVLADHRAEGGGAIGWVRGTVPFDSDFVPPYLRPVLDDSHATHRPQDWLRHLLSQLGIGIRQHRRDASVEPVRLFIKRHGGAWWFVGSKPDTTVRMSLRLPDGAPVFNGHNTLVRDGRAYETFAKTIHSGVRFFVDGPDATLKAAPAPYSLHQQAAYMLTGCAGHKVTIYPDPRALEQGRVLVLVHPLDDKQTQSDRGEISQVPHRVDVDRQCIVIDNHTGPLCVKW